MAMKRTFGGTFAHNKSAWKVVAFVVGLFLLGVSSFSFADFPVSDVWYPQDGISTGAATYSDPMACLQAEKALWENVQWPGYVSCRTWTDFFSCSGSTCTIGSVLGGCASGGKTCYANNASCPPNSTSQNNGYCHCDPGYTESGFTCVSSSGGVGAATSVSGTLIENTVWRAEQSPYLVESDVIVSNAAMLSIEAGVVIYMNPGTRLVVLNGALRVAGVRSSPVVFTSANDVAGGTPAPGDWEQIVFLDQSNDATTELDWVQIRYGKGLRLEQASPTLNNLLLQNNAGPAISMDLNSSPAGVGLEATGNTINGISVPAGEIGGSVQWRLRGIPFVVEGELSVGARPTISGIVPAEIQPGQTVDALISGTRLAGAEGIAFAGAGLTSTLNAGANDSRIPVRLVADAALPLGQIVFEVQVAAGTARYEPGITVVATKPSLTVDGMTPTSIRRGESANFVLTGTYLAGAQLSFPAGSGLSLSNLQTTDNQASFTVTASNSATLGAQTLTVTNPAVANGSPTLGLLVAPALPKISFSPSPLVVLPTGVAQTVLLRLSHADAVPHTVNLSVFDPSIATILPETVTIPAGAVQVGFDVTGLKQGQTVLSLASSTLAAASESIYVTNLLDNATVGPVLSVPVAVNRQAKPTEELPPGTSLGPLFSRAIGVERRREVMALPDGTSVGPLFSRAVGVERQRGASLLPDGTSVGPLISVPVSVTRPAGP